MVRPLSSSQTFFVKFIFPVLWIGAFGAATLGVWLGPMGSGPGVPPPGGVKWAFLAFWLFGATSIYWSYGRLKRVRLNGDVLLISDYRREIQLPLHDVGSVTASRWLNHHPVTLHFLHSTEFGKTIVFMPRGLWFPFGRRHPIVDELNALVSNARAATSAV